MPEPPEAYREVLLDPGETARPLPSPVYFVHPDAELWRDLVAASPVPLPAAVHDRFRSGADAWTLSSFLILRGRGHDVRLSSKMFPEAICVVHRDYVQWRDFAFDSYIVAVRADRGTVWISDWQVVQSSVLADGRSNYYLPYWPQPGLRSRDPARGGRVERIGFMGLARNLADPYRSDAFRQRLSELGMEFVVCTERGGWHDYRELDAVLAVREGNPRWLSTKPASKLINAWHARAPALLGPEPAYQALRESELDYFEITSPDEAIAALLRLREEPGLHASMVSRGAERAVEYGIPQVARHWEAFLSGPVAGGFARFRRGRPLLNRPLRVARFAARVALGRLARDPHRR